VRPRTAFALGLLAGAAGLLAVTWCCVLYDAWTADRQ